MWQLKWDTRTSHVQDMWPCWAALCVFMVLKDPSLLLPTTLEWALKSESKSLSWVVSIYLMAPSLWRKSQEERAAVPFMGLTIWQWGYPVRPSFPTLEPFATVFKFLCLCPIFLISLYWIYLKKSCLIDWVDAPVPCCPGFTASVRVCP